MPAAGEQSAKPGAWGPGEAEVVAILKSMGVTNYDRRVVEQLVDRMKRYTSDLLFDAKDYADHANKIPSVQSTITIADVRLAVQQRQHGSVTNIPPRDELVQLAREVNTIPLPLVPDQYGLRLPPAHLCLVDPPYKVVPGTEALAPKDKKDVNKTEEKDEGSPGGEAGSRNIKRQKKQIEINLSNTTASNTQTGAESALIQQNTQTLAQASGGASMDVGSYMGSGYAAL